MTAFAQSSPASFVPEFHDTLATLLASPALDEETPDAHQERVWEALMSSGAFDLAVDDADAHGGLVDAVGMLYLGGLNASPLPLAEVGCLGGWLAGEAGVREPGRNFTIAVPDPLDLVSCTGSTVSLRLNAVPGTAFADTLVVPARTSTPEPVVVTVPIDACTVGEHRNLADDRRDEVTFDGTAHVYAVEPDIITELNARASLTRSSLIAGAARASVHLASEYAGQRQQFGRPIGAFQAIQHLLAVAHEHALAAEAAVLTAAERLAKDPLRAGMAVRAARNASDSAAQTVAFNCHQVFGAIGVTEECNLNLFTRRMWAWEQEWRPEDAPVKSTETSDVWVALTHADDI